MPPLIRYWFNEDDFGGPTRGLDEGDFPVSTLLVASSLANASALNIQSVQIATNIFNQSDEVIGNLTPDEDYQALIVNVQQWHAGWFAGTASVIPPVPIDDDLQQAVIVPPEPLLYMVAPWAWGSGGDELAIVGTQAAPAEEDFWTNPVPQPSFNNRPLAPFSFEQHEGFVPSTIDEYYWQNPVSPVAASYRPLWPHTLDPQDVISVPGQLDEDFWTSGVAPVGMTYVPLPPWLNEMNEQAFGLVVPVPATLVQSILWP